MDVKVELKIKVGSKEIALDENEAKELQSKLNQMFGYPYPYYYPLTVTYPPIGTYPTYSYVTSTGTNSNDIVFSTGGSSGELVIKASERIILDAPKVDICPPQKAKKKKTK